MEMVQNGVPNRQIAPNFDVRLHLEWTSMTTSGIAAIGLWWSWTRTHIYHGCLQCSCTWTHILIDWYIRLIMTDESWKGTRQNACTYRKFKYKTKDVSTTMGAYSAAALGNTYLPWVLTVQLHLDTHLPWVLTVQLHLDTHIYHIYRCLQCSCTWSAMITHINHRDLQCSCTWTHIYHRNLQFSCT